MATEAAVTTAFKAKDKAILGSLKRMEKGVSKFGRSADMAFKKASRSGSRFGDITKGILAAGLIQRAARGLWDMAKGAVQLASDLMEVQNVVDVTFRGDAPIINKWAKNAINAFGLSELQAKKFTGTMGAMIKSSGISGDQLVNMSTKLTGLSGDFASFFNLPIEEAFGKIRAGISGETEPLKQLGINMSVANLQAFALAKGITKSWKAMTQAEQVQLRFNFLMKTSADAQGDFSRTLEESMANQQRVMSTRFKQASATITKGFIPVITKAMGIVNKTLASIDFDKMAKKIKIGIDVFISFSKSIINAIMPILPPLRDAFISLAKSTKNAFVLLLPVLKLTFNIFKELIPVIGFLAPLIPPLVAGFIAYNAVLKVHAGIQAAKMFFTIIAPLKLAAIATKALAAKQLILTAVTKGMVVAQWLMNAAVAAFPAFLIVAGIAAVIAAGVLLVRNWDLVKRKFFEWTAVFDNPIFAGIATILAPFVTIPILIARNWDKVAAVVSRAINIAKTAGGAVAGFFGLGGDEKPTQSQSRQIAEAPNAEQARARAQNVNISGTIGITGAPPGSTAEMGKKSASGVNMQLLGANP